jgi:hypothetical protein
MNGAKNRVSGNFGSKIYVRSGLFMAVTMKNAAFWDIKTQTVPHRRHINSPLQNRILCKI